MLRPLRLMKPWSTNFPPTKRQTSPRQRRRRRRRHSASTMQTASFNGVTPGVDHPRQLLELWGEPLDEDLTATTLSFELKGFPQTVVDFDGDQVASIRVELAEPIAAEDLIGEAWPRRLPARPRWSTTWGRSSRRPFPSGRHAITTAPTSARWRATRQERKRNRTDADRRASAKS